MKTPKSIEKYQPEYHLLAWQEYTIMELGAWVHLFVKRATHRTEQAKKDKDLTDAQNYLDMIQAHIDAARE